MNLFFLISFSAFAALFAGVFLAVLIWRELAVHFKSIRLRFERGLEPLADATALERKAKHLNRAILIFEPVDRLTAG